MWRLLIWKRRLPTVQNSVNARVVEQGTMKTKNIGGSMERNNITAFMHCKKCLDTLPKGLSPRKWARIEVGQTRKGLQIWCVRHEMNITELDFHGFKAEAI